MRRLKKILFWIFGLFFSLIALLVLAGFLFATFATDFDISPAAYPWKEGMTEAEIDRVADSLVAQMTLEEKVGQMTGQANNLWRFGMRMLFQKRLGIAYAGRNERLHIPPVAFSDGPRGVTAARGTCFPVAMARGATWDVELERRVGDAVGQEMRAAGANYFGGLCINLLRHPAWGRAQETFGEDSWHLGEMGLALMQGVQQHNVMACAKHYALNSIEDSRFYVDAQVDDRTLYEVYLPHFKKVADHGVASIMSAYNKVNGEYCGHNRRLLTGILRDEWGWKGFITSDWMNGLRDGEKGAHAGMDVEMPVPQDYGPKLIQLVKDGKVKEAQLDTMVRRILRTKLWYVTRQDPMDYGKGLIASPEHRALAREVAEKSMVLLKNDGQVLPLDRKGIKKLAVIGQYSDVVNTGDRGSSNVQAREVITPLEGLRRYLGGEVEILHSTGKNLEEAARLAAEADAVVLVAGYDYRDEGEYINIKSSTPRTREQEMEMRNTLAGRFIVGGDRLDLGLKKADVDLIHVVAAKNPKTIVTLIGGSAITMEEWKGEAPAILMAWYSGMEGGNALARILFGEANPSGRLPFTIPKDAGQLPFFDAFKEQIVYDYYHGYALMDKKGLEPAFPFGYGLSYTSFRFDSLRVITPDIDPADTLEVSVRLTNTGARQGAEVVQLYVGFENSAVDRPVKLLRAFAKVNLGPGATATVTLRVPARELAWYNPASKAWEVEKMSYSVWAGGSSRKEDLLKGAFSIADNRPQ